MPLLALVGCPSLDGFTGAEAGSDAPDDASDGGPTGGYLSLADAARFCSLALSCPTLAASTQTSLDIPVDGKDFAACVSWLTNALPPTRVGVLAAQKALGCAAQATSCANAAACMWFEFVTAGDPRCVGYTGGMFGSCSSNLTSTYQCATPAPNPFTGFIEHCDNSFNYTGSSCLKGAQGFYFCAVSSLQCSSADASVPSACSGSYYTTCQDGLFTGIDCNAQGMTCGVDPNTHVSQCLADGKHIGCSSPLTVSCAGTDVRVCDGLEASTFQCDQLGGTCDASGALARCALPGESCTPYDAAENVCTGDVISLCVNGSATSFDCTSIALHCVPGSGGETAHCG